MSEELLNVSEAAEKIGVSPRTVQRYCKQGLLNHKWVRGKRHRELRVVPPIPMSLLPGVKRGTAPGAQDMAFRHEFESLRASLTREIQERDRRIEALERQVSGVSHRDATGATVPQPAPSPDSSRLERLENRFAEFERVRPVEQKLILRLAQTVKEQGDLIRALGMHDKKEISDNT